MSEVKEHVLRQLRRIPVKNKGMPSVEADASPQESGVSASHPVAIEQRAKDAQLVRGMLEMPQWKNQAWARMALTVALGAIERGRHWTPSERLDNLMDALMEDAQEDGE